MYCDIGPILHYIGPRPLFIISVDTLRTIGAYTIGDEDNTSVFLCSHIPAVHALFRLSVNRLIPLLRFWIIMPIIYPLYAFH